MRTTLNLDDELLRLAKAEATRRKTSLAALFEDALRERLCRMGPKSTYELPVSTIAPGEGGLRPGLDWYELQYLDAGDDQP